MKAQLVRIGNSRGVRLPKPLIDQAGLAAEVELSVHDGGILISPSRQSVRAGWAEAARKAQAQGDGGLLAPPANTRFDDEEWEW